jgi:hypothetical protein
MSMGDRRQLEEQRQLGIYNQALLGHLLLLRSMLVVYLRRVNGSKACLCPGLLQDRRRHLATVLRV